MPEHPDRIIATQPADDEKSFEASLRPQTIDEYVGQARMKESLRICMDAAKQRGDALDHCIFYGPPGVGKTTIAHIIAREMGVAIQSTSGIVLNHAGDLAAILTNLQRGDVLFIDEIHRLPAPSRRRSIPPWRITSSTSSSARDRLPGRSSSICLGSRWSGRQRAPARSRPP